MSRSTLSISLVLLAALSIGIGSVLIKLTLQRIPILSLGFYRAFFGLLITALVVIITQEWKKWQPGWLGIAMALAASGLFLLGTLTYMKAVQTVKLSIAVPIIQSHPMFAILLGATVLGEQVTPRLLFGALVIIGGIFSVGLGSLDSVEVTIDRSLFWALLCSFILGLSTIVLKRALQWAPPLSLNLVQLTAALPFFYWLLQLEKVRPRIILERHAIILAALASITTYGLGQMLFLIGLQGLQVIVAAPIFSTTLLFSVLFGKLFLGEQISRMQLAGSLLVVIGITVIAQR